MHKRDLRFEECPLRSHSQCQKNPRNLKGPLRVVRLCLLGMVLPALLLALPLYMRYQVYGHQLYPLAMSDMRMLDNKVSTTWCQRQLVKVNTTFNAFLLPKSPQISSQKKPLTMVRHLELEDDTKEYWGFYLLKGSSVTVSTCVRWPGASLIVIRGHRHLHECAYIGDDSSEELDELMEAIAENNAPVNYPELMKRYRVDVEFHNPDHIDLTKIVSHSDSSDDTDTKAMRKILDALQAKRQTNNGKVEIRKSEESDESVEQHMRRNSTIAKDESKNIRIQAANDSQTYSEEVFAEVLNKLRGLGQKGVEILDKLNIHYENSTSSTKKQEQHVLDMKGRHYSKPPVKYNENIDRRRRDIVISPAVLNDNDEENDAALEEGLTPDGIADHRGTVNETTPNDMSNSEFWSSFSSSEEALLNCAGLILNLPLTPHHKCHKSLRDDEAKEPSLANTVTYKVPSNGYYFFVFNSENEVQTNYIRIQFDLEKTVYNVSNPVAFCTNNSETCAMDLKFFSSEKLVMELPVKENDTLWNEEFIVVSECEPRTAIYAACVITVPVLVVLFAFS